jgi:hypothetical protein
MNIQLLAVSGIIGAAAFFIARRIFRTIRGKKQPGCEKCGEQI